MHAYSWDAVFGNAYDPEQVVIEAMQKGQSLESLAHTLAALAVEIGHAENRYDPNFVQAIYKDLVRAQLNIPSDDA